MNESPRQHDWRDIMASALESRRTVTPHIVDDEELIARWEESDLSVAEMESLNNHLSECAACRSRIAQLTRSNILFIDSHQEELEIAISNAHVVPLEKVGHSQRYVATIFIGVLAASLIFAILFLRPRDDFNSQLTLAQKELSTGQSKAALDRLARVYGTRDVNAINQEGVEILKQAAFQTARDELVAGRFDYAKQYIDLAKNLVGSTASLENIKFQAEREIPAENAMVYNGSLTNYHYGLDGNAKSKAIPPFDESSSRLLLRSKELAHTYSHDYQIRVNRGQVLLSMRDAEGAIEEFLAASRLTLSPTPELSIGIGIAYYQKGDLESALEQFKKSLDLDPNSFDALINIAITLEKSGQFAKAKDAWQRAMQSTANETLRDNIQEHADRIH